MRAASLDRLLAVLVVTMAATGLLSLRAGSPSSGWLFVLHGLFAGALATAVTMKLRRSVGRAVTARRWARLVLGLLVSLGVIGALVGGYAWVASGELLSVGSWTVLTLHAWIGLAIVPLVAVHLLPRRWRLLRPRSGAALRTGRALLSRRSFLLAGGLAAAGVAAFGTAALVERLRGGERRFTGSRWLAPGGIPPTTTFFGEPVPDLGAAPWRIAVTGRVARPSAYDLAALAALGTRDLTAILDCTSGWVLETGWSGTPLAALLDASAVAAGASSIEIRAVTGWATTLSLAEARRCLLATHVAGTPLPRANGAPVRLVVPDRRGLDWVKWVAEVRVA